MLYEESQVQELLRRVVFQVCREPAWAEDLLQEANIHLWMLETQRPGQTLSWYVQSCRFHLLNCLQAGRSVDAMKRCQGREAIQSCAETPDETEVGGMFLPEVMSRDMLELLRGDLRPQEQDVLESLAEGLGPREISRKLGLTHGAVVKRRQKIAATALRLGITPMAAHPAGSISPRASA